MGALVEEGSFIFYQLTHLFFILGYARRALGEGSCGTAPRLDRSQESGEICPPLCFAVLFQQVLGNT